MPRGEPTTVEEMVAEFQKWIAVQPHLSNTTKSVFLAMLTTRLDDAKRRTDFDNWSVRQRARRDALFAAGRTPEAIAEYDAALAADPQPPRRVFIPGRGLIPEELYAQEWEGEG